MPKIFESYGSKDGALSRELIETLITGDSLSDNESAPINLTGSIQQVAERIY